MLGKVTSVKGADGKEHLKILIALKVFFFFVAFHTSKGVFYI